MPLRKLFGKKHSHETSIEVPVLCRFWEEDGVWNGVAQDLAVAVFGDTFEQAKAHMLDGILCHLEALQEVGTLLPTVEHLRQKARDRCLSVDEMGLNQPLVRMSAAVQDSRIVALV